MAASLRIHSWAKYLKYLGWEPIILTNSVIESQETIQKNCTEMFHMEINREIKCLIYRVAQKQLYNKIWNYKKRLDSKFESTRKEILIRKLLSFLIRNFLFLPDEKIGWYKNAYKAAIEIIKIHKIKIILSTGAPWTDFKIGYNLNKTTGVPWVADYRDPWTQITTLGIKKRDLIWLIRSRIYEKRITKTASEIIHIEKNYSKQLERIIKRQVHFIPNGYDPEEFEKYCNLKPDSAILKLSCIGTKHRQKIQKFF